MTGPTPTTPEGSGKDPDVNTNNIEQIQNQLTALKALIQQYNATGETPIKPIQLDFEDEEPQDTGAQKAEEETTDDLSKPFKEASKSPFTRRIIDFSGPKNTKYLMPSHIKLYDGSTDPDDHVTRFEGAANQGAWPIPIWCMMFQQTLDDAARGWFDSIPRGSIDNWDNLCEQFVHRFALRRKCVRDPMEITKIVRQANEGLSEFKERWTDEASRISGVPEVMQISSFIDGCKCPELAKRFSEKIPRTLNEMMIRVDDFIRSEKAYRSAEVPRIEWMDNYKRDHYYSPYNKHDSNVRRSSFRGNRRQDNRREEFRPRQNNHFIPYGPVRNDNRTDYRGEYRRNDINRRDTRPIDLNVLTKAPKEILATEHHLRLPAPPPLKGRPSRENMGKYCDYHGEKGHLTNDCHNLKEQLKRAMETGKLDHLIRVVRQRDRAPQRDNHQANQGRVINMVRYQEKGRKRKSIDQEEKWMNAPISFPPILPGDVSEEPLIVEAEVEGYTVRRVYVDQGASVEVMYEHYFLNFDPSIRSWLTKTNTLLVGFSGEAINPLGKIELEVCFGSEGLYRRTTMKFAVVRSPSPYNIILGRSGIKQLRVIPSTIHSMMKFPTPRGIATLATRFIIISECRKLEEKFLLEKETERSLLR